MALNSNFKQELLDKYKESALILDKSYKYKEVSDSYEALRQSINKKLECFNGAFYTDSEQYINKDTGEFIPLGEINLDSNLELKNMFKQLGELYIKLKNFGWGNDIAHCIDVILVVGSLHDMEKNIIDEFGKKKGQDIINEVKFEVAKFEKENGIEIYSIDVKKIIALNKLKELFSVSSTITTTEYDNVIKENITLRNADGECFDFKKTGQIKYEGVNYFELELLSKLENSREYNFYIYRIEETTNGQRFIMEEDDDIFYEVSDKLEIFAIQTEIKKNRIAKE